MFSWKSRFSVMSQIWRIRAGRWIDYRFPSPPETFPRETSPPRILSRETFPRETSPEKSWIFVISRKSGKSGLVGFPPRTFTPGKLSPEKIFPEKLFIENLAKPRFPRYQEFPRFPHIQAFLNIWDIHEFQDIREVQDTYRANPEYPRFPGYLESPRFHSFLGNPVLQ